MPLYEVAVLELPTQRDKNRGKTERLIFGPVAVVAKDGATATLIAMKENGGDVEVAEDRMQVLVRPFA